MLKLPAMIASRECPHIYGRAGSHQMCTLIEQTVEVGAPGDLNFACTPQDRADFSASNRGNLVIIGSCCPVANPDHFISLRSLR